MTTPELTKKIAQGILCSLNQPASVPAQGETPETDAEEHEGDRHPCGWVWADFARKLERERDDLRSYASRLKEQLAAAKASGPSEEVAAYIEHHKGGDNLVWERSGLPCTPLYHLHRGAPPSSRGSYEAQASPGVGGRNSKSST